MLPQHARFIADLERVGSTREINLHNAGTHTTTSQPSTSAVTSRQ